MLPNIVPLLLILTIRITAAARTENFLNNRPLIPPDNNTTTFRRNKQPSQTDNTLDAIPIIKPETEDSSSLFTGGSSSNTKHLFVTNKTYSKI
jgi:hypothetical protein